MGNKEIFGAPGGGVSIGKMRRCDCKSAWYITFASSYKDNSGIEKYTTGVSGRIFSIKYSGTAGIAKAHTMDRGPR